jgi:hypothetical protein
MAEVAAASRQRHLFGTDGVRGIANEQLTPELALKLGLAVTHVAGRGKSHRAEDPDRQGHPALGLHDRDRDRVRGVLDGRTRDAVRASPDPGGRAPDRRACVRMPAS